MFFKLERCEMPAIRTPAAVWPATSARDAKSLAMWDRAMRTTKRWTFRDIFYGRGKGRRRPRRWRGGPVLIKNRGGGFEEGVREGKRAPGECLWGGGGAKYVLGGPKCPASTTLRLLNALNSEDRGLKVRFFPCEDSI